MLKGENLRNIGLVFAVMALGWLVFAHKQQPLRQPLQAFGLSGDQISGNGRTEPSDLLAGNPGV